MNEPTHSAMTRRRWRAFLFPTPLLVLIPLLLPSRSYAQVPRRTRVRWSRRGRRSSARCSAG